MRIESGSTELLWSIASLGSLDLILINGWGWLLLFKDVSREVWDDIDSWSDGMMWGDWGFGSGVIVDGRSEGVSVVLELLALGSM